MGGQRWRLIMPTAGDHGGRPPSLEEIREAVAQRAPWPIEISDPVWLASFHCHLRSTSTYRRRRIFLAGDAAHIHSPAGGQGMNTGLLAERRAAGRLSQVSIAYPAGRFILPRVGLIQTVVGCIGVCTVAQSVRTG
ncbi:hypothetical protein E0H75_41625 [Kribbella capetownensis]|uniref:FAD-binding domain-containing protein n=1 Tax=Kribbella capetownensis TaxID=1572659 RepID=A0A4R0IS79_9ACTN|nr:FAD-dependent monooxygenase [Kribbella capetownensis]TCC35284.1 hypothetical protein E0H75_41625 [Kribbella capetownensis]